MARRPRFPLSLLSLSALLAGCAAQGPFPSLAPRAAEGLSDEDPVTTPVDVASDPQLAAQVAELAAEARRGQAGFETAWPAASASSARAGAAASETWIEAQLAISRLEAARAPTVTALAQLDRLAVERTARSTNASDFEGLMAALEATAAMAREQTARIESLSASLSRL